jgi:hypothetical protein
VQAEQPAHAEHGDEPQQDGRRRHAADVESQMESPEQAAEDVVDDQGEQQEAASDEEADTEYEIGGVQASTTCACSLGRRIELRFAPSLASWDKAPA